MTTLEFYHFLNRFPAVYKVNNEWFNDAGERVAWIELQRVTNDCERFVDESKLPIIGPSIAVVKK
jgi:hypothetical protein